ncbi:MAG TPA: plasmid pRiA4b ORF-3 family protein [Dongiaceae bacterium]
MALGRKAPLRAVKAAAPLYQLRIELLHIKPPIWRRLLVPGAVKLHRLHAMLLWTMGWSGGHLHEFMFGEDHYGQPDPDFDMGPPLQREDRVSLAAALGARKSFLYLYDFGDGWEHRVTVEKILPAVPGLQLPQCLGGANACPPEDVGGPPGYADFLQAIADPAHEEHEAMLRWCGGAFDPAAFDADHVNAILARLKV